MTSIKPNTIDRRNAVTLELLSERSTVVARVIDSAEYTVHRLLMDEVAIKEATPSLDPSETPMLLSYKNIKGLSWVEVGEQIRGKDLNIRTAMAKDLVSIYRSL